VHVRVCVDCGEEYRPEIEVCADCGGALRDADDGTDSGTDSDAPRSGRSSASESDLASRPDLTGHRAVYETREPRELAAAAETLRQAGLVFQIVEKRLQSDERRSTLVLFVREEDAPYALTLLAPFHGPDAVPHFEASERPADADARCPACEAVVPKGAAECPDCGLGLSSEGEPGENG
jgi:predicted amidophosphoribosyltransferase